MQIATVLHEDTLLNKNETLKYIGNISTLSLKLHIVANRNRVEYIYKKPGGKIIKQVIFFIFDISKNPIFDLSFFFIFID